MISQRVELTIDTSSLLILGSSSNARKMLLISSGIIPDEIKEPCIDESRKRKETPLKYVQRMALQKCEALSCSQDDFLITADTAVVLGNRVLSKASNKLDATNTLELLSGKRHRVLTSFCVKHHGTIRSNTVKSILKMRLLSRDEIANYISSNEWVGCAGSYSIQGKAKCFFPFISGCYSSIVGLPLPKLILTLKGMGFFKKI